MPQAEPVIVVGAGAIGSVYAAKLAARHPVTVVARPDHVAAIRAGGLRLIGRETLTAQVDAVAEVAAIAPRTIVLLTTKVNASEAALAPIAGLLQDDTVILCVQNGLDSEGIARRAVGDRCLVLRAITQFGAIFQEPGLINYTAAGYTLLEDGARSATLAGILTASGLDGRVCADIKTEIWRKLIYNCVINPITAIAGTEVGGIADPRLDPLKQLVIDECLAVALSQGVGFENDFLATIGEVFGASRTIASMRQDLMRGRPTEIDHMNGAVADLGRRVGLACPVNDALAAIIRAMDRLYDGVMTRVGIVAKSHLREATPHLLAIEAWLTERGHDLTFETATAALMTPAPGRKVADKQTLVGGVDLLVVLGGDGTLLSVAGCVGQADVDVPILGVNFGSLGFLTEATLPELYPSLESALSGGARVEERLMLRATTVRGGRSLPDHMALNDVVITKAARARMTDLSVFVGDEFVTRVKADGLIVATPTGSTAYNLAAGGPIVQPVVDAIVLTPIAPHMLTNRPIVIPAASLVRVQPAMAERDELYVTFDGQAGYQLEAGDEVRIQCAARRVRLLRPSLRSYFEVLRQKLKWNER